MFVQLNFLFVTSFVTQQQASGTSTYFKSEDKANPKDLSQVLASYKTSHLMEVSFSCTFPTRCTEASLY